MTSYDRAVHTSSYLMPSGQLIGPLINQGEVQSLLSALEAPNTQEEIIRGSPTKGPLSKIKTKAPDSVHTIARRRKGQKNSSNKSASMYMI